MRVKDILVPNETTRKKVSGAYREGGVLGVLRGGLSHVRSVAHAAEPTVRDFTRAPLAVIAGANAAKRIIPPAPQESSVKKIIRGFDERKVPAVPPNVAGYKPIDIGQRSPASSGAKSTELPNTTENHVDVVRPDGTVQRITKPKYTGNYAAMVDKDGKKNLTAPMPWNTRAFIQRAAADREASLRAQGYNVDAMAEGATVRARNPAESLPPVQSSGMTREARAKIEADQVAKTERSQVMRMLDRQAGDREDTERIKSRDAAKAGMLSTALTVRGRLREAAINAGAGVAQQATKDASQAGIKQADALFASFQDRVKNGVPVLDSKGRQQYGKDKKPLSRPMTPDELRAEYQAIGEAMGLMDTADTASSTSSTRQVDAQGNVWELVNGQWVKAAA